MCVCCSVETRYKGGSRKERERFRPLVALLRLAIMGYVVLQRNKTLTKPDQDTNIQQFVVGKFFAKS